MLLKVEQIKARDDVDVVELTVGNREDCTIHVCNELETRLTTLFKNDAF